MGPVHVQFTLGLVGFGVQIRLRRVGVAIDVNDVCTLVVHVVNSSVVLLDRVAGIRAILVEVEFVADLGRVVADLGHVDAPVLNVANVEIAPHVANVWSGFGGRSSARPPARVADLRHA
ncbi:MAG: hypothetical protein H6699_09440 [Myxococcales bacterium]|nr:hypothetical protein [Myxococcales bacterium]